MSYPVLIPQSDCYVFEDEIRQLVEAFGYSAETTQASGDFGADVVAWRAGKKVVIQCKLYSRSKIGCKTVSELEGSRRFYEATHAILITTSSFTKPARTMAEKIDIHLVDGEGLAQLCRQRSITIPSVTYLWNPDACDLYRVAPDQRLTFGRAPDNRVVIADTRVSRRHAVLHRSGMKLIVTDAGSRNGTFVNETRLTGPMLLNYGDRVSLGRAVFLEVVLQA